MERKRLLEGEQTKKMSRLSHHFLPLSLSIYSTYLSVYAYWNLYPLSFSLSLSLSIYIYIYVCLTSLFLSLCNSLVLPDFLSAYKGKVKNMIRQYKKRKRERERERERESVCVCVCVWRTTKKGTCLVSQTIYVSSSPSVCLSLWFSSNIYG